MERLSAPQEPVYDADAIAGHFEQLTALDEEWQGWFLREKIEPLRLTYEALSADPRDILARTLDKLGLNRHAAKGIRPTVAKLADTTSRRWMERFRAESYVDLER